MAEGRLQSKCQGKEWGESRREMTFRQRRLRREAFYLLSFQ